MKSKCKDLFKVVLLSVSVALPLTSEAIANKAHHDKHDYSSNQRPSFIRGDILKRYYDGNDDDLLTAGLGASGLKRPDSVEPPIIDAANPSAAEIRRVAVWNNYRALVDTTVVGGYTRFYGPNIDADGNDTGTEGLVPGYEFIAYSDNGSGRKNVTIMVQVPDNFDPYQPCIVTAPSSGSRGVYGAIGTAGEWGLKRGCAVTYTDKGTGTGAHSLGNNSVSLITGERANADSAGKDSNFTAKVNPEKLPAFNIAYPDRFAFKHAHSGMNPEKDWGKNVLESVEFAFYVLNELHGHEDHRGRASRSIVPENTIVIASSVSNGGGASLRAVERDRKGLIDGVAVSEPNVNPKFDPRFGIQQGNGDFLFDHSRSLYDYTSLLNVYQGCASMAPGNAGAPFNFAPSPGACSSLHDKGLLASVNLVDQATEAQQIINDYGLIPEQNIVQPSHWFLQVSQGISVTYANAYAHASVLRNLCGYSMGATDAIGIVPLGANAEAKLFGVSNGIPPSGGVNLINNLAADGPQENRASTADQNLDGSLCLRSLATGRKAESGSRLRGGQRALHRRILSSIKQIRAGANLHGLPAVIVTGRADAIIPVNHGSRPYYGRNQLRHGNRSNLRYYEITNAQHLDVLNGFGGFDIAYVPLHHYFNQAMDLMWAHLVNGKPLPPSQVVHTTPRGVGAPPLMLVNIPDIEASPATNVLISFDGSILNIPD